MYKLTIFFLFIIAACTPKLHQSDDSFTKIFNGNDFSGWVVPEDNIWWKAGGGILSVESGPDLKGNILWSEKVYKDFIIKCDFKFGKGTVDSGIFMRSDHDQIQIGISGSLKRDMTCSPYIPGKGYPVEATGVKDLLKLDDWNSIQVKAVGNHYTAWLNGKEVMQYTSETASEEGPVGFQLHGNKEMSIEYRNILISELP